ncbi:MAG: DMT family transporter [Anaerolineaceae bacterium]|nr:DMT family transporter [Anaerolineaceae bacterium]
MESVIGHETTAISRDIVLQAIFYMILSALCFAVVELTGTQLVHDISAYQLVWGRYVVHLLFMVIVLGPRYKTRLVRTNRLPLQITRSLTMLGMPLFFLWAASTMPINDVWAVYWISPLIALVFSVLILREPVGRIFWMIGIVGFGAMAVYYRADRGILSLGSLYAVGMGACLSLHLTLSRILRNDHPLTSLFHTALWVFIPLTFVMPFVWETPSPTSLVGIVIIGLVGALGLYALARSGELAPLPLVASFGYTERLWTVLLDAVLFGLLPGKGALLAVVILCGVTIGQFVVVYRRQASAAGLASS